MGLVVLVVVAMVDMELLLELRELLILAVAEVVVEIKMQAELHHLMVAVVVAV